jgi:hypothetical protein
MGESESLRPRWLIILIVAFVIVAIGMILFGLGSDTTVTTTTSR